MNFLASTDAPIIAKIGDVEISFSRLTLRQCGEISSRQHQRERQRLLVDMKEAGEEPAAISKALRELDWRAGRLSYGVEYASTAAGVVETLEVAARKTLMNVALSPQAVELAVSLWQGEQPKGPKDQGQSSAESATG